MGRRGGEEERVRSWRGGGEEQRKGGKEGERQGQEGE